MACSGRECTGDELQHVYRSRFFCNRAALCKMLRDKSMRLAHTFEPKASETVAQVTLPASD